jgi:RND family efflux transporter MFP subunit
MNEPTLVIQQQHGKMKWFLIGSLAAIILLLFLIGGVPRLINSSKVDALANTHTLPKVSVREIKPNTKAIELVLPTSAQAWHITPIWSRVNGYLLRYLVDIGDMVKTGDLIAEIDTPETDEQLAQAKADLANSIIEKDIAKITSDRWQQLWDKNKEAVSKQEVDQYNANLKSTEAVVTANEKNVSRLTFQQQFKNIYAPFDGVITQRLIDIGSLIYGTINGTPQELFQIAQVSIIRFFVQIPQTYFRNISEGVEAEISIQEFPDRTFRGKVTRYAKALDPTSRTMLTEIDIENKDGILYAGLYGNMKFLFYPENINFIIPTTAVIIRSALPHVATVDKKNIVHLKQVEIGLDYGNEMEITHGLNANDRIIILPNDRIVQGAKVEIIPEISKKATS